MGKNSTWRIYRISVRDVEFFIRFKGSVFINLDLELISKFRQIWANILGKHEK